MMDNEELMEIIDTMQKIIDGLLVQNAKLHEELEYSNRDFFVLAGVTIVSLLLVLYAVW